MGKMGSQWKKKEKEKKADSSLQLGPVAELPSSYNILFFFFWWGR
jgi:hypothetical protein